MHSLERRVLDLEHATGSRLPIVIVLPSATLDGEPLTVTHAGKQYTQLPGERAGDWEERIKAEIGQNGRPVIWVSWVDVKI